MFDYNLPMQQFTAQAMLILSRQFSVE